MEFISTITDDNLYLVGAHWHGKTTCVIHIHGMAGCIQEHHFCRYLGEKLEKEGIGYLYAHNRGYGMINDILVKTQSKTPSFRRYGAAYDRFEECVEDIRAWIREARQQGYEHIILLGHSLGCNKILHYLSSSETDITGIIFAAPPDIVHEGSDAYNLEEFRTLAEKYLNEGKLDGFLGLLDDDVPFSAASFSELYFDGCVGDNLPLRKYPEPIPSLQNIRQPLMNIVGSHDHILVHSAEKDLAIIKENAVNATHVTNTIIDETDHIFYEKEEEFASVILEWLKRSDSKY